MHPFLLLFWTCIIFFFWILPYFLLKRKGLNTQVYFTNLILGTSFISLALYTIIHSGNRGFLDGLKEMVICVGIWVIWGILLLLYSIFVKNKTAE